MSLSASALAVVSALVFCQVGQESPSPAEIAVLEARNSITAGHVIVESKMFRDGGDALKEYSHSRYAIWFDKDRLRTDRQIWRAAENGDSYAILDERVARVGSRVIRYNEDPNNRERRILAHEVTPGDGPDWEAARKQLFDIRLLGLNPVPFPILHSQVPNAFVGATRRSHNVATEGRNENGRIMSVSYTTSGGSRCQLEIALDRGPNLLKGVLLKDSYRDSIECTLARFPSKSAMQTRWFPSVVVYSREKAGRKTLVNEVRVIEAVFDEPQAESVFHWEGLGAVPGTVLRRSTDRGRVLEVFDGTSTKPFRPEAVATLDVSPRRYLLRVGIGFGVLAVMIYIVLWFQRRVGYQ